jgi:predicted SnoaL-like aldol condensation-catalyzing enzyme
MKEAVQMAAGRTAITSVVAFAEGAAFRGTTSSRDGAGKMHSPKIGALAFGAALFLAGTASAAAYPTAMTGKAKIACDFEAELIYARKIDLAPKYVHDDFIDHNTRIDSKTIAEFQQKLATFPKLPAPASGCGQPKVVLNQGDYVLFLQERPQGSHFDLYRFEGDKIAEHWD